MKSWLYHFVERLIRNFVPELRVEKKSFRYMLYRSAIQASVDFARKHMVLAHPFDEREPLYQYVVDRMLPSGLIIELGVHDGHSINAIADMTDRTVYGFDSFEGLPDDGDIPCSKDGSVKWYTGKMSTGGVAPKTRPNVELVIGWFDETLPKFFDEHKDPISLMHIDCDIYSSTITALNEAEKSIVKGTIIVFDEYLNHEEWEKHEHRALVEFSERTGMKYEFIAYSYIGGVAIRVLEI